MADGATTYVEPVRLRLDPQAGALAGSNTRYEKTVDDLRGVYRDADAFEQLAAADNGEPLYWVETSNTEGGPGGLITGTSVLQPGRVADEYFMTRGHLHVKADRAELYVGLAGHGVMLLETLDGESRAVEVNPGEAVYVPGQWVHRSINVGDELFVTLFCYASDAGQNYQIIEDAGGMKQLIVAADDGGWTTRPNPDHSGYGV